MPEFALAVSVKLVAARHNPDGHAGRFLGRHYHQIVLLNLVDEPVDLCGEGASFSRAPIFILLPVLEVIKDRVTVCETAQITDFSMAKRHPTLADSL